MLSFYKNKIHMPTWLLETAIIFFITLFLLTFSYVLFETVYKNKIYPNVFVGSINVGGKTKIGAEQLINQKIDALRQNGVTLYFNNYKTTVVPIISSTEGDLAYEIISFSPEEITNKAISFGRDDNFFINLSKKIKLLVFNQKISANPQINEKEIKKILTNKFSQYLTPAQDAKLVYAINDAGYEFSVEKEKFGQTINYQEGIEILKNNLSLLNPASIYLKSVDVKPQIYQKNCLNIGEKTQKILNLAPVTFFSPAILATSSLTTTTNQQWIVEKNEFVKWLKLETKKEFNSQLGIKSPVDNKVYVGLDEEKIKEYLKKSIAPQITRESKDAKFTIKNGRVAEFQQSQDGIDINYDETIKKMKEQIVEKKNNQTEIVLIKTESTVREAGVNDLGIKEIIGTGKSNFAGSPKNRRHNIKIGANTLHGVLIKPGEEFSLLKAIGKVEASTGYLPELVIKENKTTPEYGGGLCQIGTTMFRAAIETGLPITARRNHSYRVQYYEPAGTDATIYSPAPDLKFINDTPAHVLIQSRLEGDNLYFDFWGASDGRLATHTKSVIYNIVKPHPTKIIETLDLGPDEKKCTEKAHNGADAYFDYIVTYPNGEEKKKRFSSHYVPWQAVCLLGVKKLSNNNPPPTTASSTITNIGTSTLATSTQ